MLKVQLLQSTYFRFLNEFPESITLYDGAASQFDKLSPSLSQVIFQVFLLDYFLIDLSCCSINLPFLF